MSEEEKKAITYLKFYIERDVMYEDTHYEQIKTILNLIEKQQKEIEELKDIKADYIRRTESSNAVLLKQGYINKDKIREKIEELEKQEDWYTGNKGLDELYGQIDILKELLEE